MTWLSNAPKRRPGARLPRRARSRAPERSSIARSLSVLLLSLLGVVGAGWGSAGAQPGAYSSQVVATPVGVTVGVPTGLRQAPGLGAWPDTPVQVEGLATFTDGADQPLTIQVRQGDAPAWESLPAAGTDRASDWALRFAEALQVPGAYDVTPGRYDPERGGLSVSYKIAGPSAASLMMRMPERHPLWLPTHDAGEDPKLAKCVLGALLAGQLSASEGALRARAPIAAVACGLPAALISEYLQQLGPSEFAPSLTTVTYLAFFSRSGTIGTLIMAPLERQQAVDAAAEVVWAETEVATSARLPVAPALDAFRLAQLAGILLGSIVAVLALGGGLSWLLVRLGLGPRLAVGSALGLQCALALTGALRTGAFQLDAVVLLASYLLASALAFQPLVRWLSSQGGSPLRRGRPARGLSTVETVVLLVLVACVALGTWRLFGQSVQRALSKSSDSISELGQLQLEDGSNPNAGRQPATPGWVPASAPRGPNSAGNGAGTAPGRATADSGAARPVAQGSASEAQRPESRGSIAQGAAASALQAMQPGQVLTPGPSAPLPANAGQVVAGPAREPSLLVRGADIATDFIPYVSNVKDATTAYTGINPVTKERASTFERVAAGVFAIPGAGNLLKYAAKGTKYVLKGGRAAYEAGKAAQIGTKIAGAFSRRAEKELAGEAAERLAREAEELGEHAAAAAARRTSRRLATEADEAVFWSGIGENGERVAAEWAEKNGGKTMEKLLAERSITLPPYPKTGPVPEAVEQAWRDASREFAQGASGNVRVLQQDSVSVGRVWGDVEFKELVKNPNVKSITAVDPRTGQEILLWQR